VARAHRGFTLLEIVIALFVLEVGILGLVATAGAAARLIGRARRSSSAATFAAQRLERLRVSGCGSQAAGSEVRGRADMPIDSISWRFVDAGNGHWRIVLSASSRAPRGTWSTDSLETEIACRS